MTFADSLNCEQVTIHSSGFYAASVCSNTANSLGYIVLVSLLSSDPAVVYHESFDISTVVKATFEGDYLVVQLYNSVAVYYVDFLAEKKITYVDEVNNYHFETTYMRMGDMSSASITDDQNNTGARVVFTDAEFGLRAADFQLNVATIKYNMPLTTEQIPDLAGRSEWAGVAVTNISQDNTYMEMTVLTK